MPKTLQELTIRDDFMFAAVMTDREQCRQFLSTALEMNILSVDVATEKTFEYNTFHGIRLDVVAEEQGQKRRFNVELQIKFQQHLPKRSRYYHAHLDMDALLSGHSYGNLPDTYVIFICDFAPFVGSTLYKYTYRNVCQENGDVLDDGRYTVFLSTKGTNDTEIPQELMNFLHYVGNPARFMPPQDKADLVRSIQKQIDTIKRSRDWEARFMLLQEKFEEERKAGEAIGEANGMKRSLLIFLDTKSDIPENIRRRIEDETDSDTLKRWLTLAFTTASIEDFCQRM